MNLATPLLAATVHFVGIIAFMPEPTIPTTLRSNSISVKPVSEQRLSGPEDHGVRLAATRLPVGTPIAIVQPGVLAVMPQDFPTSIPQHRAMILYRTSDYTSSSGLTHSPLSRPGIEYVTLNDGDIVTFDTGGATNPPSAFPKALPHNPARSATNTQLNLLTPYDPNDRTHATLVRIAGGVVSVCQDNGRYDTNVGMNAKNSFVIRISTKTSTRTLTLKPGAEISIVNVPFSYADTLTDNDPNKNHYQEYCVMAGIQADNCPAPSWMSDLTTTCPNPGQDMLAPASMHIAMVSSAAKQATPMSTMGAMADCSNTQFP